MSSNTTGWSTSRTRSSTPPSILAISNGRKRARRSALSRPADGLPATPESWGILTDGPHPNAARLYHRLVPLRSGQKAMADNLFLHSARHGAAPPPGGEPLEELKLC